MNHMDIDAPTDVTGLRRAVRSANLFARDFAYACDVRYWFKTWPKFAASDLKGISDFIEEHGWVIIKNVFSASEISNFRTAVKQSESDALPGELLSNPYLGGDNVILNDRVLAIVGAILGGDPAYFGDSSWFSASRMTPGGFHKDNADRENDAAPDWQSPYTLVRMGIYLQDHVYHSGGLALRDGSHRTVKTERGRPLAAQTEPGDLVVWTLKTSHSGFATRPRFIPNMFVPLTVVKKLSTGKDGTYQPSMKIFRAMEHQDRLALFSTFGRNDHHLERYVMYLKTRQYAVRAWQKIPDFTDEVREMAKSKRVGLVEIQADARAIDTDSLNVLYKQLAW